MELHYKVYGEGEPVVILHGLFGMLDNWQSFAKSLAEHYMVYVVDQRDHGRSPHTTAFDYGLLADDIKGFCDLQWIYKARFIGHSMGGKTLLELSKHYPDLIDQMVIVDMGTKQYPGGHESIISALQSVPLASMDSRSEAADILATQIDSRGVIQFLLKNLTRRKDGTYAWKMNLDLLAAEYSNVLSAIEYQHPVMVDTLWVRGGKSAYIVDSDIEGLLATYPQSRLETVADAGHWVHAERPMELLELVTDFFDRVDSE